MHLSPPVPCRACPTPTLIYVGKGDFLEIRLDFRGVTLLMTVLPWLKLIG
ncbi:hypothetical protein [Bradyrhizobium sp.]|jgi:hypothetical protein